MANTNPTNEYQGPVKGRDARLGAYGLYTEEKTNEVGLRQALLDTASHLAQLTPRMKPIPRLAAEAEVDRLRREAAKL